MNINYVIEYLRNYKKEITIMEVCGTHTHAIAKNDIRGLISPTIRLISGPGCPVCVTSSGYIDTLIKLSSNKDNIIYSFGDMFKVRGKESSLSEVKHINNNIEIMYTPLKVVEQAKKNQDKNYYIAAVGFETTAPLYALAIDQIKKESIKNIRFATSLKTMINALDYICNEDVEKKIDGFLCPGHVSALIGERSYDILLERHNRPLVISGFEPEHILLAIYEIISQIENKEIKVKNLYKSIVTESGNTKAMKEVTNYFKISDSLWRGIGIIKDSGFELKEEYKDLNVDISENINEKLPKGCKCSEVILGRMTSTECPLFGNTCNPDNPIGPCMVSEEGSCGIWYKYKGGLY